MEVTDYMTAPMTLPFNSHSLCPNDMLALTTNSSNIELAAAKKSS